MASRKRSSSLAPLWWTAGLAAVGAGLYYLFKPSTAAAAASSSGASGSSSHAPSTGNTPSTGNAPGITPTHVPGGTTVSPFPSQSPTPISIHGGGPGSTGPTVTIPGKAPGPTVVIPGLTTHGPYAKLLPGDAWVLGGDTSAFGLFPTLQSLSGAYGTSGTLLAASSKDATLSSFGSDVGGHGKPTSNVKLFLISLSYANIVPADGSSMLTALNRAKNLASLDGAEVLIVPGIDLLQQVEKSDPQALAFFHAVTEANLGTISPQVAISLGPDGAPTSGGYVGWAKDVWRQLLDLPMS